MDQSTITLEHPDRDMYQPWSCDRKRLCRALELQRRYRRTYVVDPFARAATPIQRTYLAQGMLNSHAYRSVPAENSERRCHPFPLRTLPTNCKFERRRLHEAIQVAVREIDIPQ